MIQDNIMIGDYVKISDGEINLCGRIVSREWEAYNCDLNLLTHGCIVPISENEIVRIYKDRFIDIVKNERYQ